MTASATRAERLFSGQLSSEYNILEFICPAAGQMSRHVGDYVARLPAALGRPLRVFEIGCGTGATTAALLRGRPDVSIIAVDNESSMVEQARANLAEELSRGRVRLIEADALKALQEIAADDVDVVASSYAIHNFLDSYRRETLAEIFRVLAPGGVFVNGDRYAVDDPAEHTRLTQDEVRNWFKALGGMGRQDLLEQWVVHLFSDESPDHIMRLAPSLQILRELGFDPIKVEIRDGINALLTAAKPAI